MHHLHNHTSGLPVSAQAVPSVSLSATGANPTLPRPTSAAEVAPDPWGFVIGAPDYCAWCCAQHVAFPLLVTLQAADLGFELRAGKTSNTKKHPEHAFSHPTLLPGTPRPSPGDHCFSEPLPWSPPSPPFRPEPGRAGMLALALGQSGSLVVWGLLEEFQG